MAPQPMPPTRSFSGCSAACADAAHPLRRTAGPRCTSPAGRVIFTHATLPLSVFSGTAASPASSCCCKQCAGAPCRLNSLASIIISHVPPPPPHPTTASTPALSTCARPCTPLPSMPTLSSLPLCADTVRVQQLLTPVAPLRFTTRRALAAAAAPCICSCTSLKATRQHYHARSIRAMLQA